MSDLDELAQAVRSPAPKQERVRTIHVYHGNEHNALLIVSILCVIAGVSVVMFGGYVLIQTFTSVASNYSVPRDAQRAIDLVAASGALIGVFIGSIGIGLVTLGMMGIVLRDVAQNLRA